MRITVIWLIAIAMIFVRELRLTSLIWFGTLGTESIVPMIMLLLLADKMIVLINLRLIELTVNLVVVTILDHVLRMIRLRLVHLLLDPKIVIIDLVLLLRVRRPRPLVIVLSLMLL
jgi:hypothetical protein